MCGLRVGGCGDDLPGAEPPGGFLRTRPRVGVPKCLEKSGRLRLPKSDGGARFADELTVGEPEELCWLDADGEAVFLGAACRTAASTSLRTCSGSRPVRSRYVGSSFQGSGLLAVEPPVDAELLGGGLDCWRVALSAAGLWLEEDEEEPGWLEEDGGEALLGGGLALCDVLLLAAAVALVALSHTCCGSRPVCSK